MAREAAVADREAAVAAVEAALKRVEELEAELKQRRWPWLVNVV